MAKNSIISSTVAEDASGIIFAVAGVGSFVLHVDALNLDIRTKALIHGLVQKISDAAAIPKADLPTNPTDAAKAKFDAMKSVADRLADGDWSKRSGDGAGPVAGIIYRAFEEWALAKAAAAKKPISSEQIRSIYDAKDRAGQLALRSVPEIATIIERIKSERGAGAKAVDASGLLGELGL